MIITMNIDTMLGPRGLGICNGRTGRIVRIGFEHEPVKDPVSNMYVSESPPLFVEVLFDEDCPNPLPKYPPNVRPIPLHTESGTVKVQINGIVETIRYNYQGFPFMHADAATLHSLQGSTKTCPILVDTNLADGFKSLDGVALYVAMTRVTKLDNLYFTEKWTLPKLNKFKPSPWMLQLFDSLDRRHANTLSTFFPNEY